MTEVTITTRGEHNSTARADSADLTLDITTEEDRDHAPARVERTLAILVSTLQQLAPNIPSTRLPQSTTKVLHPASDAAVASYTVARVRVVALKAPSSMMVSKTSSVSVLKSSGASKSAKESVRASTRIVIAFRDVAALQRFAAKAAAVPFVSLDTVTWKLGPVSERHVRRAARTAALGDAYERAWDLAAAGAYHSGPPPDTPTTSFHAVHGQQQFALRQLSVEDTTPTAAKANLTSTGTVRTLFGGQDGLTVDMATLDPPELGLCAAVEAKYAVSSVTH